MWKKVGACCVILAIPALWGACAGETFVNAREKLPCDTSDECPQGEGDESQCTGGRCACPNSDEEFCCDPGSAVNECNGHCRPAAECDAEPCKVAEDCTGPVDTRCGKALCVQGICHLAINEQFQSQLCGDCKEMVCDMTGRVVPKEDPTDVFNDFNECTLDTCVNGDVEHVPLPEGEAPSGSGACDGAGRRAECVSDDDCIDPSVVCSPRGSCVPSSCRNGVKDTVWGETAIDCGGRCDPCRFGIACEVDSDCIDLKCGSDKKCNASECDDQTKNGTESAIDCGGHECPPCSPRMTCHAHSDCDSGVCIDGQCVASTCGDGAQNRFETDIDCGGGECPPCPLYINPGTGDRH